MKTRTILSLIADNLCAKNIALENEGGKEIKKVNIPVEGEAKGFDLTHENAKKLVAFRNLLTVPAKIKLEEMEYETQIELSNTVISNW